MRQGMDRGKQGPERRGTSRVSKAPAGAKPTTSRMSAQQGSGGRGESSQRGGPAPAQDGNKNMLYIGLGGGALLLVLIVAFMASGSSDSGKGGGGGETLVNRAISKATDAYTRGEYRVGLDICEEALKDPRARKSSRYNALNALAGSLRAIINHDRTAQEKVGEFKRRIEAAKADQTAMAKANQFWAECNHLLGEYGATSSAKELRGIKEDLGRWVSTEKQGDWQKDYNVTKGRIEKSFLSEGKFAEAIREWKHFGEISQDPLLHSRIEQEILSINQKAEAAAEKLVADAGTGADARTKLEEAQQRFNGTSGLAIINKAIKSLK